jgi:hypothetical protein
MLIEEVANMLRTSVSSGNATRAQSLGSDPASSLASEGRLQSSTPGAGASPGATHSNPTRAVLARELSFPQALSSAPHEQPPPHAPSEPALGRPGGHPGFP